MEINENKNRQIEGLKFVPSIEDNDADSVHIVSVTCTQHFTPCTAATFKDLFSKVKNNCKAIFEIGVMGHHHHESNAGISTEILKEMKNKDTAYLGVDIEHRSIQDDENNIHFLQADSMNTEAIHAKIKELEINEFDFIFIDGWHSVNAVLHEWENYIIPFLSKKGIVAFHDVHTHPGPYALFEAVDTEIFESKKYCHGNDYGIGAMWYK